MLYTDSKHELNSDKDWAKQNFNLNYQTLVEYLHR